MKPRKPSKTAVKVRLAHPYTPNGIIASVDYHPTEREQQRLYWHCDDKFCQTTLNLNLATIKTNSPFAH